MCISLSPSLSLSVSLSLSLSLCLSLSLSAYWLTLLLASAAVPGSALAKYSVDLTKLAKEGKLDPVIGREEVGNGMEWNGRKSIGNQTFHFSARKKSGFELIFFFFFFYSLPQNFSQILKRCDLMYCLKFFVYLLFLHFRVPAHVLWWMPLMCAVCAHMFAVFCCLLACLFVGLCCFFAWFFSCLLHALPFSFPDYLIEFATTVCAQEMRRTIEVLSRRTKNNPVRHHAHIACMTLCFCVCLGKKCRLLIFLYIFFIYLFIPFIYCFIIWL